MRLPTFAAKKNPFCVNGAILFLSCRIYHVAAGNTSCRLRHIICALAHISFLKPVPKALPSHVRLHCASLHFCHSILTVLFLLSFVIKLCETRGTNPKSRTSYFNFNTKCSTIARSAISHSPWRIFHLRLAADITSAQAEISLRRLLRHVVCLDNLLKRGGKPCQRLDFRGDDDLCRFSVSRLFKCLKPLEGYYRVARGGFV